MAPDRSKAGGNRNRPDVLTDPRAIQRVHLDHHQISSHQNVVKTIQDTPITDLKDVEVDKTSDDFAAGQSLVWGGDSWIAGDPEVLIPVKAAEEMTKGTPVYVSDEQASGKPIVSKADSDGTDTYPAIGLLLTDLAAGAEGHAVGGGIISGLDTTAYTDSPGVGDALYISSTPGVLTGTRPTATNEKVQKVAVIARSHGFAGTLIVMGAGRTNDVPNELTALTGVPLGDSDLGSFTGTTIADNETIKGAIQDLETAVEAGGGVKYHGRYDTEAAARTVVNGVYYVEFFYTARPDGDGLDEDPQSDASVPALSYVERRLYFSDKFNADPSVSSDWTAYTTQPADNTSYADAKTALLAGLNDTDATANTRGTLPLSLKIERRETSDLLLEDYPGAVLACSVRKIRGAYTGPCMAVRKPGEPDEDIGFDANGNLDVDAIKAYCGTSNGYVAKWYDQSGNGNDWEQPNGANQPQIYDGSQVLKVNTKPSIRFFNTPSYMQQATQALPTSGGYAFAVMGVNPTATNRAFGVLGSNTIGVVAGLARDGNTGANVIGMTVSGYYVNGTQITSPNQDKLYDAAQEQGLFHLADYANTSGVNYNYWPSYPHITFYANAQMQEFIAYHSDQSSNQSAIEAEMQSYYDVDTTDNLLEDYSGAAAAYSVRKISRYSTALCMRVREHSGNTETDIGFDANGELDVAAIIAHCGTANGYVVKWYDQSGNGNHGTQTTAANQPQIYDGNAIITKNGKPAAQFDGTNDGIELPDDVLPSTIETCSAFTVQANTDGISFQLGDESTAARWYQSYVTSGTEYAGYAGAVTAINLGASSDTQKFITAIAGSTQTNYQAFVNGTAKGSQLLSTNAPASGRGEISRPALPMTGTFQEAIVYHSDQSTNRTAIESNIDTYYETTTSFIMEFSGAAAAYSVRCLTAVSPAALCMKVRRDSDGETKNIGFDSNGDLDTAAIAAHCGSANGYVDTWYDQSGNANNLTQSTATLQPRIYDGSAVITRNGKPAVEFDDTSGAQGLVGSNLSVSNRSRTMFSVTTAETTGTEGSKAVARGYSSTYAYWGVISGVRLVSQAFRTTGRADTFTAVAETVGQQILRTDLANTTTSTLYKNGSSVHSVTDINADWSMGTFGMGGLAAHGGGGSNHTIAELVVYESDQGSNRTNIESNINTYYSIY